MTNVTQWLTQNHTFAEDYHNTFAILPPSATILLTCADARVDPAYTLGLQLGEAIVLRGLGGRVTDDVERDIAILSMLARQFLGRTPRISLAIIQHTDCGFERLAQPALQAALSQKLGIPVDEIAAMAVADHQATLQADIDRLSRSPLIPDDLIVSGYLYGVEDGLVREMIAPHPLRSVADI